MSGRTVKVYFRLAQDESEYPPTDSEFLWCAPTERGTYVVDNIPFFVRDIGLGDEISVEAIGKVLHFSSVIKQSRNSTIRVLFKKPGVAERIQQKLTSMGCSAELMDKLSLLAMNMPQDAPTKAVLAFLDKEAEQGNIGIEESAVRY